MKLITLLALSMLCCLSVTATDVSYLEQYNKSLEAWQKLNPYNYTYTVIREYTWPWDELYRTSIQVVDDKVVRREFEYEGEGPDFDTGEIKKAQESWVEDTPETIGSHGSGYSPKTMEQIYLECFTDYINRTGTGVDIYFGVDWNGILRQCGHSQDECQDACPYAIDIADIVYNKI